jgi:hypothetical protein
MSQTHPESEEQIPQEEPAAPVQGGHRRRPPLAEIDSWELWQAWKRGERARVLPWVGLLTAFCVVLAGMYSFFYFSTSATGDTFAQVGLTIVFLAFLFVLWRRISARRDFALAVVGLIVAVSGAAFLIWLLAYRLSGWNPWAAIGGTLLLGLAGVAIGLPSLNALARQEEEREA